MKLTQTKTVREIVRPPIDCMPDAPAVSMDDAVMRAIELMVKHDCREIAVMGRSGIIGSVRLADALRHLGLRHKV